MAIPDSVTDMQYLSNWYGEYYANDSQLPECHLKINYAVQIHFGKINEYATGKISEQISNTSKL
jgi:hypothetical protein